MNNEKMWSDVSLAWSEEIWRKAFEEFISQKEDLSQVMLTTLCSFCEQASLRRYYLWSPTTPWGESNNVITQDSPFKGHGALWRWCATCRIYDHYSALVPNHWNVELILIEALRHTPAPLEEALENKRWRLVISTS